MTTSQPEFYANASLFFQKVSEYDQEAPQSHIADRHREEEPQNVYSNNTSARKQQQINQLSLSLQDDCKTRMDTN